ncbi:hypothetical protein [Microbacterium sp. NPDC057650]|uniref:hypothetical protein n=1 Tax=unclassified Microbacterium TaxID=2609290 RepID=UPI00366F8B48
MSSSLLVRELDSDLGVLRLEVRSVSVPVDYCFEYHLLDSSGQLMTSTALHGADEIQALTFCLAAAGDYIAKFIPSARWGAFDNAKLFVTVPDTSPWRATTQ